MLPPAHRLRSSAEFGATVRQGRRASRPLLTVHAVLPSATPDEPVAPARAGLVVSKAVGGSVVRHRTARRLRHLLAGHLVGPAHVNAAVPVVPAGTRLVVRAAPAAGTATSAALGTDLAAALARLLPAAPALPTTVPPPVPPTGPADR